ncbi:MAG: ABC transporter permease [Flavobacteriaceae bacterium]|nr:ABC transporter permease [Flavobacteriaceae bacterium]
MNVALFIAKRYLFTKNKNNAINVISSIAAFGVVVCSASLFIVLCVFAGLRDFSLQFSTVVDPDLRIEAAKGKSFRASNEDLLKLENIDGVVSVSKIIEERVVLNYETKNEIVTLKGVDEFYPKSTIDSILTYGNWMEPNTNQIVSGWGISNTLSFGVFDFGKTLKIYVPKPGKGQISSIKGAYNALPVANSGVFQINEELDYSIIYSNFDTAKTLLEYGDNQVSALEVITNGDSEFISEKIKSHFNDTIIIKNRAQLNDALYKMLNTENLAVYLIFTLILIIALFNVIGSMIMMILDKKKNLGTLYNLGTTVKEIRRIFFLQGFLMSALGGVLGVIIGFILVLNQIHGPDFLKIMITPSLPYPASIKLVNFFIVILTTFILGLVASKIASSRISIKLITEF